jgi:hypothetical protein
MKNKINVGDVVEMSCGYGTVQQIIGKNYRILLSGQYGYGEWYTLSDMISHATLYPK